MDPQPIWSIAYRVACVEIRVTAIDAWLVPSRVLAGTTVLIAQRSADPAVRVVVPEDPDQFDDVLAALAADPSVDQLRRLVGAWASHVDPAAVEEADREGALVRGVGDDALIVSEPLSIRSDDAAGKRRLLIGLVDGRVRATLLEPNGDSGPYFEIVHDPSSELYPYTIRDWQGTDRGWFASDDDAMGRMVGLAMETIAAGGDV